MDLQAIETVRRFYDKDSRELYVYALVFVRDRAAAEDIVHGVFERLLRRLFLPRDLRPYVYRAVRNASLDLLRHNHRVPGTASLYEEVAVAHASEDLALREEAQNLLGILSADERECVVLKLFNELTFHEIAAIRGVSINTAASWYRRAIEKMRVRANEEDPNERT